MSTAGSPTGTYHQGFDGKLLQASVPWRVKDDGHCLVRGLDIANLYFVLGRARGGGLVPMPPGSWHLVRGLAAWNQPRFLPLVAMGKFVCDTGPQRRGSELITVL